MDGVLVSGTGLGVGATAVAAALARSRPGATYVVPVQAGPSGTAPAVDVVAGLAGCPVRQGRLLEGSPVPAVAARRARIAVRRADLLAPFAGLDVVVGQGAGGLLTELGTDGTTLADLAADLELPLVLAAPRRPDVAGQVRLALEAAWARGLVVRGVVVTAGARGPVPDGPGLVAAEGRGPADAVADELADVAAMAPVLAVVPAHPADGHDLPEVPW